MMTARRSGGRPYRWVMVAMVLAVVGGVAERQAPWWPDGRLAAASATALEMIAPAGGGEPADQTSQETSALAQEVRRRYRVVRLTKGVVLIPREPIADVASIEIGDGIVAIDGAPVTGRELRARLGSAAGPILALTYLDSQRQRELLEALVEPPALTRVTPPEPVRPPEPIRPPAAAAAPAEPAEPVPPATEEWGKDDRTHSNARIRIGGDIRIDEREIVDGAVVAVGGRVRIDGVVRDDVVAVGGSVHLGPRAEVAGDVVSVGGSIERDPGAKVRGQLNEIAFRFPGFHVRLPEWPDGWWFSGGRGPVRIGLTAFRMLFVALVAFVVLLVARRPVERVADAAAAEPWKAGAIGLLAELFVLPVLISAIVILAVSIIGIPLLVVVPPLIVLALVLGFVLGFSGVVLAVGRWFAHYRRWRVAAPFGAALVGLLVIWMLTLAGRTTALIGWPLWVASATLLTVGFLVEYAAWTVGLGAALMTRFGTRPSGGTLALRPSSTAVDLDDI